MEKKLVDSQKIKQNGWKQGAFLSIKADERPFINIGLSTLKKTLAPGRYVLLSQDCDILHGSLINEPVIELIRADLIKKYEPECINGKNPRKLHLQFEANDTLEFFPHNRFFINRNQLEILKASDTVIKDKELKILTTWVAKRYIRPGFPDEFNNRVKPINKKLKRIMETIKTSALGLHIDVSPNIEIKEDEIYNIRVVMLAHKESYENEAELNELNINFDKILILLDGVTGIKVDGMLSQLRSTSDINLFEAKKLTQWDFDYLSYLGDDAGDTVNSTLL